MLVLTIITWNLDYTTQFKVNKWLHKVASPPYSGNCNSQNKLKLPWGDKVIDVSKEVTCRTKLEKLHHSCIATAGIVEIGGAEDMTVIGGSQPFSLHGSVC